MKKTVLKYLIIAMAVTFSGSGVISQEQANPKFFNEVMKYRIDTKGFQIGSILMRTKVANDDHIQINASVYSFKSIQGLYYVRGTFGAVWNFKSRRSYLAWEDVYQGYEYQQRSYKFSYNNITLKKREKKFSEAGYPHKGKIKKDKTISKKLKVKGYEYNDLLGAFYYMRTGGKSPEVGTVTKLKVLPAGKKKIMYIKVLEKTTMYVKALNEKRAVFHVRTGIIDEKDRLGGGDIFIATEAPVDIYITDDEDFIPVLMTTNVPVLGKVEVILDEYEQVTD
ncbi:MAG: DUF3108 domain-containing protein [Leptospirales bacterium]